MFSFFFLINTVFICLPFVKPWTYHFVQAAWGFIGKGAYKLPEKEPWEVEMPPLHGKENEKGHHQAESPMASERSKAWVGKELLVKKGPLHNQWWGFQTVPTAAPEPASPTVAAPTSLSLAAVSSVPWNGTDLETVARNKWGWRTWGFQALRLSCVSVSGRFSTTADSDQLPSRGASDQGGGGVKLGTGAHFQGMREGLWQKSCSQCREDRVRDAF